MTGFNPIGNTANVTAQGRGPAFQPVQSNAVSYPARPTLNPQPGQGGGMNPAGAPGMPGSSPDGMMGGLGAFGAPGQAPGGPPGAPGGPPMPGMPDGGQMGPASTAGLLGQEENKMVPGGGGDPTQAPLGGNGAFAMGGLKPASPISGASGFGNGMAGRSGGAFGGGASGFGRR